jgi:hypothetical protein
MNEWTNEQTNKLVELPNIIRLYAYLYIFIYLFFISDNIREPELVLSYIVPREMIS